MRKEGEKRGGNHEERDKKREDSERNTEGKDKIVLIKIRERITQKDRGKAIKAKLLI